MVPRATLESFASTNFHKEKQERLQRDSENIEMRLDAALEFKKRIEALQLTDGREKIITELDASLMAAKGQFPPEVIADLELLRQVEAACSYEKEASSQGGRAVSQEYWKNWDTQLRLESKPDVFLLRQLEHLTESLKEKNAQVLVYKDHPEQLAQRVVPFFTEDESFWNTAIEEKIFSPFSVTCTIQQKYWDSFGGRANGFHLPGTPIVLARKRKRELLTKTFRHEQTHNSMDGLPSIKHKGTFTTAVEDQFHISVEEARCMNEESFRESQPYSSFEVQRMIDSFLHEELLTHIKTVEEESFDPYAAIPLYLQDDGGYQVTPETSIGQHSTAGGQVLQAVDFLREKAKELTTINQQLSALALQKAEEITQHFLRIREGMRRTLAIAKRIGPEAHEQAHMLLYFTKPSQYAGLPATLRRIYGSKEVNRCWKSFRLADMLTPQPNAIERCIQGISPGEQGEILEIDKEKIVERFSHMNLSGYGNLGIATPEAIEQYISSLDILSKQYTLPIDTGQVRLYLRERLMQNILYPHDNIHTITIEEALNQIIGLGPNPDELPYLQSLLGDLVFDLQQEGEDFSEITAQPWWTLVEQLGLADAVINELSVGEL